MTPQDAIRFAALRASHSPEDIEKFHLALLADHDAIARYDWLKDNLPHLPKEQAKAIYAKLDAEQAKYPGMVVREDALFGRAYYGLRAKLEIFRGVKRDADGKLRIPPAKRAEEIERLKDRAMGMIGPGRDLMGETWGPDVETLKANIAHHQDHIDGRKKTRGTVWDFVHGIEPVIHPDVTAAMEAAKATTAPESADPQPA